MTSDGVVLVLNCGSSSVKYELMEPLTGQRRAHGSVERIGEVEGVLRHQHGEQVVERTATVADHTAAIDTVLAAFADNGPTLGDGSLVAIGHRVVMGGIEFSEPVVIDDEVEAAVDALSPLAPLHNPANLAGIRVARAAVPAVPHVAVFDTSFFQSLPMEASTYAIDRDVAEAHGIRRYGFHGTSHRYVSGRVAALLGRHDLRQIVLHLGNGASASAVVGERPVATSMGLTPLEGLVMGTRCGDLDPAIVLHLQRAAGMTVDEVDVLLNRRSGLVGLTGHNDVRDVRASADAGDARARLALDVYVRRVKHYIGAYAALMGGLDAVTFTAGVGENDGEMRAAIIDGLDFLGLQIDPVANAGRSDERIISPERASVKVIVIPTDEELAIARDTLAAVR